MLDHVNFYKLVEISEGTFEIFEFGMDVIKAPIIPRKRTMDEKIESFGQAGPTLRNGNFIWTASTESIEFYSLYSTQMITICSSS